MIKVLIVDDDIQLAASLLDYLSLLPDMDVVEVANNGVDALQQIKQLQPDVVLLDITMPKLDGIGVLEQLDDLGLEQKPSIIIHSAQATDHVQQHVMALGVKYFLIKPCGFDVVAKRIRQFAAEIDA